MFKPLLVLLLSFTFLTSLADNLSYTVIHDKKPVGQINISRTTQNDVTQIKFESNVVVNMLFTIKVYDKMDVTFKGNQLINSYLYRTLNGRVRVKNYAVWNGKHYVQTDKDDEKSTLSHLIYFTTASLYYQEPIGHHHVYSEKFQKMIPIKVAGNKRYLLELPNGNKVYYSYHNGVCSLVEAETDWANLQFVINKRT